MKITVLTGSPHKKGTSLLLADKFIQGAESSGHEVFRFDSAFEDVKPCLGCNQCKITGQCVRKDAMEHLYPKLLGADAIVFITPLYYFTMTTQLKAVVDRFYSIDNELKRNKKTALLATANNPDTRVMDSLVEQYQKIVNYMNWKDVGRILATGCGARSDIEQSIFPEQAYKLGTDFSE